MPKVRRKVIRVRPIIIIHIQGRLEKNASHQTNPSLFSENADGGRSKIITFNLSSCRSLSLEPWKGLKRPCLLNASGFSSEKSHQQ